ncbi:hypothetical protein ACQKD9_27985 [Bacillus paramycoides]|uniref:hypothetical protein n=1 Tax=Bacillus paramycoides TaxID=2026194 RepID=UPI003D00CB35
MEDVDADMIEIAILIVIVMNVVLDADMIEIAILIVIVMNVVLDVDVIEIVILIVIVMNVEVGKLLWTSILKKSTRFLFS